MTLFLIILMTLFILSFIMIMINFTIMKKLNKSREKVTPIECGFNPPNINHHPFSVQFYIMSIIFLIFDVETTILFPMILNLNSNYIMFLLITGMLILIILLMGIFMEWKNNIIEWF